MTDAVRTGGVGGRGPRVSVLIPCHDAVRWVGPAIESALGQSHPSTEVLVVDDGSADTSLDVIRSFGDRIRWETGPNRGGNAARNRLTGMAGGEWLQYLDADDYLRPAKVADQLADPAAVDGVDVLCGGVTWEYLRGDEPVGTRETLPPEPFDPWEALIRWQVPQTGGFLFRKSAVVRVGGWREDQPCCQENELCLRLLAAGSKFAATASGGAVYRQWSEETVCRRDPARTFRERLKIVARAEAVLEETGDLTADRREAVAHARLECARVLYHLDRPAARSAVRDLRRSHPGFRPRSAGGFPRAYRRAYRLLGFEGAEVVASAARAVRRGTGSGAEAS